MSASNNLDFNNAFIRYHARRKAILMDCMAKLNELTVSYNIECNKIRQKIYRELGR